MATGPEHYAKAEHFAGLAFEAANLVNTATRRDSFRQLQTERYVAAAQPLWLQAAQVHATLALAAATAPIVSDEAAWSAVCRPPAAVVAAGDPDPTRICGAVSEDGMFGCTDRREHAGQHVAGDGVVVRAVWPAGGEI